MKAFTWTVSKVENHSTMAGTFVRPIEFVRRQGEHFYRQYGDSKGRPLKGAGKLFNVSAFVIGQNPCRTELEKLGLK